MGEAGLAGWIDLFNRDVTDGGPSSDADIYYKAGVSNSFIAAGHIYIPEF